MSQAGWNAGDPIDLYAEQGVGPLLGDLLRGFLARSEHAGVEPVSAGGEGLKRMLQSYSEECKSRGCADEVIDELVLVYHHADAHMRMMLGISAKLDA